jgi:hypothetical protein
MIFRGRGCARDATDERMMPSEDGWALVRMGPPSGLVMVATFGVARGPV